jgi:hypothetical protein
MSASEAVPELRLVRTIDIGFELEQGLDYSPELLKEIGRLAAEVPEHNLAEFLLGSDREGTAVYWVGEGTIDPYVGSMKRRLLGVNYTGAHSEGDHKVVVQDAEHKEGPWVLYAPPGTDNHTFHLEDDTMPRWNKPTYRDEPANPLKIREEYLYAGNPGQIFTDFQDMGYDFVDTPMPLDEYETLRDASRPQQF